jgi:DNA-binding MarR family transcriptional regulator
MPAAPPSARHCALHLRPALSRLQRRLRRSVGAPALPSAKLSALALLHGQGPLTATRLAALEGVKPQSLTRLLAELEAEGLLRRDPHPSDGRQALLALTRAGAQQVAAEARRREAALAAAIGRTLDERETELLARACALLERVADGLAQPAGAATEAAK